jgi:hypothetical protein
MTRKWSIFGDPMIDSDEAPPRSDPMLTKLQELEEMGAKLLAAARKLPSGPDRHKLLQEVGRFRAQIAALQGEGNVTATLRPPWTPAQDKELQALVLSSNSVETIAKVLNRSDKALRTPAFDALIDVMHEARLLRFGTGKAHLGAAFHALWVFVETLGLVLWHCAPHGWLLAPCALRFHNWKVAATNQNLPFTR